MSGKVFNARGKCMAHSHSMTMPHPSEGHNSKTRKEQVELSATPGRMKTTSGASQADGVSVQEDVSQTVQPS